MTVTLTNIRKSKHGELFACLDALEKIGETWRVGEVPAGTRPKYLVNTYNFHRKASRGRRVSFHTLDDGFLFVRVK